MKKRFWKRITALACAGIMTVSGISWSPVEAEATTNKTCQWNPHKSASGYRKIQGIEATATSEHVTDKNTGDGPATWMVDNNKETLYHSRYANNDNGVAVGGSNNNVTNGEIFLKLPQVSIVHGITYLPRGGTSKNGLWKKVKIYVSSEEQGDQTWLEMKNQEGNSEFLIDNHTDKNDHELLFERVQKNVKRVKIQVIQVDSDNTTPFVTATEVGVLGSKIDNVALNKTVTASYNDINAHPTIRVNKDRPGRMAVDGKKDQKDFHMDFGSDDIAAPCYAQIDLGEIYNISSMHMYRYYDNRKYKDTLIAVASNVDEFDKRTATVIYNADKTGVHGFVVGTEENYEEKASGKFFFPDKDYVQGRYVRIYMNGRENTGNTNHIVEFEVYGRALDADYSQLNDAIAKAKKRFTPESGEQEKWYTSESLEAFKTALLNAENIAPDLTVKSQSEITTVTENLNQAMANLEFIAVVPEAEPSYTENTYNIQTDSSVQGEGKYKYNQKCVLKPATAKDGKAFRGWKLGEDVVFIGTGDYTFYVTGDYNFTAIYDETLNIEPKAILKDVYVTPSEKAERSDITFTAQIIVPQGNTLNKAGLVWGINAQPANRRVISAHCNYQYQFSITIKNVPKGTKIHGYIYAFLNGIETEYKSAENNATA